MKKLFNGTEVSNETPTRNTSEGRVLLTETEISESLFKQSEHEKKLPMILWQTEMAESDGDIPRWAEELILGTVSSYTIEKAEAKRAKRERKPKNG